MEMIKMAKLFNKQASSLILSFVIILTIGLFFGTQAQSQIINVPAGDTAALIQAINDANAAPDVATLNLGGGTYTLSTINNSANGDNGLPSIVEDMTINGNGSIIERSNNPGTQLFRIIHIGANSSDPNVTLNNLTISNGFVTSTGGSLINVGDGIININDCLIIGNNADNEQSAGVNNDQAGTMNVLRTTITDNVNIGNGVGVGGIINDFNGVLNITDSTISNNLGPRGGGVGNNSSGTINMVNTTVSGNTSTRDSSRAGGGVYNNSSGDTFIDSSTITNNEGEIAGNIGINSRGSVFLINSIVSGSVGSESCGTNPNSTGQIVSDGYNIDDALSCGFNSIGDKSNTNPGLGPLENNGGPTDTHLLLNGSPAIDMGNVDCPPPATDQRGVGRPIGGRCDIGAVEVDDVSIPTLSEWGLIAMAGILGIVGFMVVRRRQVTA